MGSMVRVLALALALGVPTGSALARPVVVARPPVVHVAAPVVHVGVGPIQIGFDGWSRQAVPVQRQGYVWVQGHYGRDGYWNPGHYVPVVSRPGHVWEPGHWQGTVYVDGFWRPVRRDGCRWVPGHYTPNRGWVEGHWSR